MEILVADQAQQPQITVAQSVTRDAVRDAVRGVVRDANQGAFHFSAPIVRRARATARQVAARRRQRRAGAVLQAAMAVFCHLQHEQVVRKGRFASAMPEADLRTAQALHIGEQALAVERRPGTADDEPVFDAAGLEAALPETPERKRVVDELPVVGRLERARPARGHRRGHQPAGRQAADLHPVRLGLAPFGAQEQAAAIEEATLGVEKGAAHRSVEGVHAVAHHERGAAAARCYPARLVALHQCHLAPALVRRQVRQMAREFAHQVAAGNPHRQAQDLLGRRTWQRQRDTPTVRLRVVDLDPVAGHLQVPAAPMKQLKPATVLRRKRRVSQAAMP